MQLRNNCLFIMNHLFKQPSDLINELPGAFIAIPKCLDSEKGQKAALIARIYKSIQIECEECAGIPFEKCDICHGSGFYEEKIPAAWEKINPNFIKRMEYSDSEVVNKNKPEHTNLIKFLRVK